MKKNIKNQSLAIIIACMAIASPITSFASTNKEEINTVQRTNDFVIVEVTENEPSSLPETNAPFRTDMARGTAKPSTESHVDLNSDTGKIQYTKLIYGNKLLFGANTLNVQVWNESSNVDQKFTVTLYESNGTKIGTSDMSIGKRVIGLFNSKTATFKNLSASKRYYFTLSQSTGLSYEQTYKFSK